MESLGAFIEAVPHCPVRSDELLPRDAPISYPGHSGVGGLLAAQLTKPDELLEQGLFGQTLRTYGRRGVEAKRSQSLRELRLILGRPATDQCLEGLEGVVGSTV